MVFSRKFHAFLAVTNTRGDIRTANKTLHNIEQQAAEHNAKIKQWNDTMSAQLKLLRDKIAQAKHAAEGVSFVTSFLLSL